MNLQTTIELGEETHQFPPLRMGSPGWQLSKPFSNVINSYNSDKIFGRSEKGYVGMFPWTSITKDEIYLLFGGDFPFVLRKLKREGHFQLVVNATFMGSWKARSIGKAMRPRQYTWAALTTVRVMLLNEVYDRIYIPYVGQPP